MVPTAPKHFFTPSRGASLLPLALAAIAIGRGDPQPVHSAALGLRRPSRAAGLEGRRRRKADDRAGSFPARRGRPDPSSPHRHHRQAARFTLASHVQGLPDGGHGCSRSACGEPGYPAPNKPGERTAEVGARSAITHSDPRIIVGQVSTDRSEDLVPEL
jgi:hypothetical protein